MARSFRLSYDVPGRTFVGHFGDKFRKAREKKQFSLDDVSSVTKISARMLRAIEEERFDQLPGGIFNKGFIRTYAKHLGLDDECAVNDYLVCVRQAQVDENDLPDSQASRNANATKGLAPPQKHRLPDSNNTALKSQNALKVDELRDLQLPRAEHLISQRKDFDRGSGREIPWTTLAFATVLILSAVLWVRHPRRTGTLPGSSPAKQTQPTIALSVAGPTPVSQRSDSAAAAGLTSVARHLGPNAKPPQVLSSKASENSGPTGISSAAASAGDDELNVTARTAKSAFDSSANFTSLNLVIRATETSWISVQADGKTVNQEMLIAPAQASIRASREIVARIGNAAGVTFLWNGREIPGDGAEAEVKTFVFDSNGVRVVPSAPVSPPR